MKTLLILLPFMSISLQGCVYLHRPINIENTQDNLLGCKELLQEYEVMDTKSEKFTKSQERTGSIESIILFPLVIINPIMIMNLSSRPNFNEATGKSYFCRKDHLMKLMENLDCPKSKYGFRRDYAYIDNALYPNGKRDFVSEYCQGTK